MNIFGFGKSGDKTYGVASDKPDWWPDNMGFALFKGPNFATIKDANQILEALFESNNLDIHEHFSASALTMDMAGKRTTSTNKKKTSKKRRVEVDDDTEEEDNDNYEDGEICDDEEIIQNNNNDSDNGIDIEPSDYELLHEKNIEERKRMYELAGL